MTAARKTLELGQVRVHTPVILAPMAGVTGGVFRRLCRQYGERPLERVAPELLETAVPGRDAPAGLYVAEMVTARALLEGDPKAWHMVTPDPAERVKSVQLYGTDPRTLGVAAGMLVERGLADHIDLNFGCPVPKVTRKGGGAAIPWKRDLFGDMVSSVVRAVDAKAGEAGRIPVTVKMRIGIDETHITALDAARIAQSAGVAGIGLHARTQEQYYSGAARWEWITRVKEQSRVPVFGNGDVFEESDAQDMMEQTGCDAVIVGRGAQGRPWLFENLVASFWSLPDPGLPTLAEVREMLLEHARETVAAEGNESRAIREMRKHVGWYLKGFPIGGKARGNLHQAEDVADLEVLLSELDGDLQMLPGAIGRGVRAGNPRKPHLPHGWLDSPQLSEQERTNLPQAEDGVSGG